MSLPQDPIAGIGPVAIALHELFTSLRAAGFTENQALYLTGRCISGQAQKP